MSKVKSLAAVAIALALATSVSQAAVSVDLVPVIQAAYSVNSDGTMGAALPAIPDISTSQSPAFYEVHFLLNVTGDTSTVAGPYLAGVAFGLDGLVRQPLFSSGVPVLGLSPVPGGTNTLNYTDAVGNPISVSTPAGSKGLYNALTGNATDGYAFEDFVVSAAAPGIFKAAASDQGGLNLEDVVFEMNKGTTTAAQKTVGSGTPFDLGVVDIYWDGHSNQTLGINGANNVSGLVQFNTEANGVLGPAQFAPDTHQLSFVGAATTPEPASLGLLALGGVALLARRKKA